MEIGASTLYGFAQKKPGECVQELVEKGVDAVELTHEYPARFDARELKRLKEFGANYSVHLPFACLCFAHPNASVRKPLARLLGRAVEDSVKLEADCAVLHSGDYCESWGQKSEFIRLLAGELKPIAEKAADGGVKLVAENLPPGQLFDSVESIKRFQEALPETGFCLDIGHAEAFKQSVSGIKVDHVHAHDNFLEKDDHLAVGKGGIDFTKWLHFLRGQRYSGKIIVESLSLEDALYSVEELRKL